jgi:hypothetical protein
MHQQFAAVAIRKALEGPLVARAQRRQQRRLIDLSRNAGVGCHDE